MARTQTQVKARIDAVELLERDHREVENLFRRFKTGTGKAKKDAAEKALRELVIHSLLEEELFYPAVRRETGDKSLVDEAKEEHHVVDLLISELAKMSPGAPFDAKFTVLSESVVHHIEEEEKEMFPEARRSGIDLAALGEKMAARKEELKRKEDRLFNVLGRTLGLAATKIGAGKPRRGRRH